MFKLYQSPLFDQRILSLKQTFITITTLDAKVDNSDIAWCHYLTHVGYVIALILLLNDMCSHHIWYRTGPNPNISHEGNCDTCNWVINTSRHRADIITVYICLQLPSRGQWNPATETMAGTLDAIKETAWLSNLSSQQTVVRLSHVNTMCIDTTLHPGKRTQYFTRYEISFPIHQNWLDMTDLIVSGTHSVHGSLMWALMA